MFAENTLVNGNATAGEGVIRPRASASTSSLGNANFRQVRLGETTYMGRSGRGTR
jgi:hypothetical protein